jgi:ABC-type antimicrobial peptide transport system permease subunit
MGIRMALGATSADAMRTLVVPGVALAAIGAAIGTAVALSLSSVLRSFVWGVSPTDPVTFVVVVGLVLGVATVAGMLPALRISRLDPALTLRAE